MATNPTSDVAFLWPAFVWHLGGTFSLFYHPGLVKRDFFLPMESLGTLLENGEGMKPSPLVELNPNMPVRDVERMEFV